MQDEKSSLSVPHVQAALLSEAVRNAQVGVIVWDDDRRYVAANERACELLGCTLDELIGSVVGSRTAGGEATVDGVVRSQGGIGQLTFERFDGKEAQLGYVSFATRIGGVAYMGSVIWPL
jgi:PAS domain-containing protein